MIEIKGAVLHRVRLLFKVPGWLSDLNALLKRRKSSVSFYRV